MSYPEAVFHLLSLPLLWKSREVVYLATDYPKNCIRKVKQTGKSDEKDVFHDGLIEYYQNRPTDEMFDKMPLIVFASWYVRRNQKSTCFPDDDNEPEPHCKDSRIKLLNGKGFMTKKVSKNIIRLPKLNCAESSEESERFYFSKLMAYVPWRADRLSDILTGFSSYHECFLHHAPNIQNLMMEYEKGSDLIQEAFEQIQNKEPDLEKNMADLQHALEEDEIENISCFPQEDEADFSDEEKDEEAAQLTKSTFEEMPEIGK